MNDCKFSGRPTRDPEIRYTEGAQPMAVARYTLAVDRKYKKEGGQQADFLSIVAFGKTAEFVEKYIKKGIKVFHYVKNIIISKFFLVFRCKICL